MLKKVKRSILIGMCFGDAYLKVERRYGSGSISIVHCEAQSEYIHYKANLLSEILNAEVVVKQIDNNGYPGLRIDKGAKIFRLLRQRMYNPDKSKQFTRKNLDKLTPEGIAIWYMDDGSLTAKKKNGKIHAYELTINTYESAEVNDVIIQYFKDIHDISFTKVLSKGLYRLRCGTKQARKFCALIAPHIILSMQYKLLT